MADPFPRLSRFLRKLFKIREPVRRFTPSYFKKIRNRFPDQEQYLAYLHELCGKIEQLIIDAKSKKEDVPPEWLERLNEVKKEIRRSKEQVSGTASAEDR